MSPLRNWFVEWRNSQRVAWFGARPPAVLLETLVDCFSSLWKLSLTLWKPYMFNWRMKEAILVCLKYCAKTFENSSPG